MFNLPNVATLKLVSAVLLLQQLQVSIHLLLLLLSQFLLHPVESLLLRLLGDPPLESLALDPLLKHRHLILVVSLNRIHHEPVLQLLPLLILLVLPLLLQ